MRKDALTTVAVLTVVSSIVFVVPTLRNVNVAPFGIVRIAAPKSGLVE